MTKKVPASHIRERQGIHGVGMLVYELGWVFREQDASDFGIDAHIEPVHGGRISGRLLAAQIKSGASFFEEKTDEGFVFRGDPAHLDYWLDHALPVIVILYDEGTKTGYWQHVSDQTITRTKKAWKMIVPSAQRIDKDALEALSEFAEGDPALRRLRWLVGDRHLMEAAQEVKVLLEVQEWVNKTSGRGEFRVVDEAGRILMDWRMLFFPFAYYERVLPMVFPWADLSIDEDHYEDYDRAQFELEDGIWDSEDKVMITFGEFEGWKRSRFASELRPYEDNGEVAFWRLELTVNDLGRGYLAVADFLAGTEGQG